MKRISLFSPTGFSLIQVLVVQAVAILLIAALLPVAMRSAKVAGGSSSRSAFQDLVRRAQFSLAETNFCGGPAATSRIIPLGGTVNLPPTPTAVRITDPSNPLVDILRDSSFGPPIATADFTITDVKMVLPQAFGRPPAPNVNRYLGEISVKANRSSTGTFANFLGSQVMTESIPIMAEIDTSALTLNTCSIRKKFLTLLGPPGPGQKSSLECIDRDGVVVKPVGATYYVCRIPFSGNAQLMFPNDCEASTTGAPPGSNEGMLHVEGWVPAAVPATATFKYCI